MKKVILFKRLVLSLFIIFMTCSYVSEGEVVPDVPLEVFMIGDYVVYKYEKGYSVLKGNKRSHYYRTVTLAIRSINEKSI